MKFFYEPYSFTVLSVSKLQIYSFKVAWFEPNSGIVSTEQQGAKFWIKFHSSHILA